jgi:hypothetical protein
MVNGKEPGNFQDEFVKPALKGLPMEHIARIGLALDCAVMFGALEKMRGNVSLSDQRLVEERYKIKVAQLKRVSQ